MESQLVLSLVSMRHFADVVVAAAEAAALVELSMETEAVGEAVS